jgi:hypothetical protein
MTEPIMDSVKIDHVGAVLQYPPINPLSLRERGPAEVSGVVHRPETPNRLWIQSITFKSVYL